MLYEVPGVQVNAVSVQLPEQPVKVLDKATSEAVELVPQLLLEPLLPLGGRELPIEPKVLQTFFPVVVITVITTIATKARYGLTG